MDDYKKKFQGTGLKVAGFALSASSFIGAHPVLAQSMPILPEKNARQDIPSVVQQGMQSVLPLRNITLQEPEDGYDTSYGTLTIIAKAGSGTGPYTYYGLTAGHVIVGDAANSPEEQRSNPKVAHPERFIEKCDVRTPAGKMAPLTYVGLAGDNTPQYQFRDVAVVSFQSSENIPVARLGSTSQETIAKGPGYYLSGYPHQLTTKGINGIPYGKDFTNDPDVVIAPPVTTISKSNPNDRFVTQMVTDTHVSVTRLSDIAPASRVGSRRYQALPEFNTGVSHFDLPTWSQSGVMIYDANTQGGHSGSPVWNQNGEIVAIHNGAKQENGDSIRGRGPSYGTYIDGHTRALINRIIQKHALDHDARIIQGVNPEPASEARDGLAKWRAERQEKTADMTFAPKK